MALTSNRRAAGSGGLSEAARELATVHTGVATAQRRT
jgi:hypothetical protein